MGKKQKRRKCFLLYTGFFLMMCVVSFFPFFAEGKSFIWGAGIEDGLSQHFTSLAYYGRWLREIVESVLSGHPHIPMWNMGIGYGADIISTLNYYAIGDPLNLLYGFVPWKDTEIMYHVMIILRMYLAGIAFILYCIKMKKRTYGTVIGAVAYVFCGFCFRLGIRHPFFLNPMIYFPLLCMGIEEIYMSAKDTKIFRGTTRPFLFILSVALSAISNYYFLYMLTIFSVIYAWIRFYKYVETDRIHKFFLIIRNFAIYYMIGISMAAIILLPSVIGFLGNGRNAGVDLQTLIVYPAKFYILLLSNVVGYGNAGNNTNIGYLPIAGIAILFVLFSERMKHKKYRLCFIGCIIALALPVFGYIFNGLSYASNRWSFVVSFIVALLIAEMYPRFFMMTKKQKIGIGSSIVIYNVFIFLLNISGDEKISCKGNQVAGILLFIFYGLFVWFQAKGWDSRKMLTRVLIGAVVIISAGVHGYYRFSSKQKGYTEEFLDYHTANQLLRSKDIQLLKSMKKKDTSLYRVHAQGYPYKNYGLYDDLNTISGYYSITSADVTDTVNSYQTLGMQYADKYCGVDQRTGLLSLSGVKYITAYNQEDIPDGFTKIKTKGNITLYKNKNALPFAYAYDRAVTKKQYDRANGAEREQMMLDHIVLDDVPQYLKDHKNEKKISGVKVTDVSWKMKKLVMLGRKNNLEVMLPSDKTKETYLYFKNLIYNDSASHGKDIVMGGKKSSKGIRIEQKGVSQKIYIQSRFNPYYFGRKDYIVKLNGNFSGQQKIKMAFLSPGTYQVEQVHLIEADKKQILKKLQERKKNKAKNIKYHDNQFEAKIYLQKRKMLCITIPYSKGWEAEVDGKKTPILKANGMYMGVSLKKGNHKIRMTYRTPGLKEGMWMSVCGWIVFCTAYYIYRRENCKYQS
ncbi:YfhO family protein [Anaerostipes sp. MSJ-23]|uniref:YfhO family protein n=1 Tax=Anaerostipes sp. MSJ-23 TaxID=2841520 RepID=UPI001C111533|nr:YfhO family protein [Anaerostipes sp. MSJ-23]MBU5459342.1 YfhO family protein [Anaerostipes sp. MSJ-23]